MTTLPLLPHRGPVRRQELVPDARELARRIETAEAHSAISAAVARRVCLPHICIDWERFGSTCAVFAGHWTHLTHAIVTSDDVEPAEVRNVRRFLNAYQAIPTISVSSLFDTTAITGHGFTLVGGADVLVTPHNRSVAESSTPVSRVPADDCVAKQEWITTTSAACLGRELISSDELEIGSIASEMRDTELFTVSFRDNVAAGGALYISGRVGILFCDSTLPEYRGKGFHRDLIGARVQAAWDGGCEFVAATVQPGSASARNYLNCGFERAYSRLTFQ